MEPSAMNSIYQEEIYSVEVPVTVVINKAWKDIQPEQRELLAKILQAVKHPLESVKIIQQPSFDLSGMNEKPKRMIAFMTPPKGLALYEVIVTGETAVVFSDDLEILTSDDAAKRKLWNTLKAFFSA